MPASSAPMSRRTFLKRSIQVTLGLVASTSLSGAYSRWIEPYWTQIEHVEVRLAKLPSNFDSFRIVHFSDLHMGFHTKPEQLKELTELIRLAKPDIICFTGDLLDHSTAYIQEAVAFLSKLRAPYGQYAVLGNHDAFGNRRAVTKGLAQAGFEVLDNKHVALQKEAAQLCIAGVDDPWVGKPNIDEALRGIPDDACTVLLVHEPDFADEYSQYPVDLQLSGHTHGGQVRIPLIGALYTPPYGSNYTNGLYQVHGSKMQVYTTRGVGMTRLPIRFHCRPELTVITLKSK